MLQITPHVRILVAIEPVDLRKGIDGLAELSREKLAADPFSGRLFVFRGRPTIFDALPKQRGLARHADVHRMLNDKASLSPG